MRRLRTGLIGAYLLLFVLMLLGALRTSVSNDASEAMLEKSGQPYQLYLEYLENYPTDVGAIVVFVDLLCSDEGWDLIKRVERDFEKSVYVEKTSSIVSKTAKYITSSHDSIDLQRFLEIDSGGIERCKLATDYPPFRNLLVSSNAKATALYVTSVRDVSSEEFAQSVIDIRNKYNETAQALGGKILLTGDPIMSAEIGSVIANDIQYVIALVVILLIVTFVLTRSLSTCFASLLTMLLSLTGAFGFMGWFGLEITPGTALAIFLLAPLSAAFVIHAHGYVSRDSEAPIIPSEAITPTLFAGATTAILFSCTAMTPAPDVRSLATLGVVGILFATLALFLIAFPILTAAKKPKSYSINFAIPIWILIRPWVGFLCLLVFLLEIAVGLSKLRFEYEAIDYLPLSNPTRAEFEEVGQWFGRMTIPLVIRAQNTESPEVWVAVKALEQRIQHEIPGVTFASFHKQIAEVTKAVTLDETGEYLSFPQDTNLLSQIMLLFDPEDYEDFIGRDGSSVVAMLHVPFIGSSDYFRLKVIVDEHFSSTPFEANLVGRVSGFFESGHRVGLDNIKGLIVGAILIFLLLLAIFKSLTLASIGLVVNAIPVLASLGALGIADVPIDLGSSIVTAIAFGIVVDDSTHLMLRIKRLQQAGYDPSTATVRAIRELIAPISTTTAMTCIGFTALFFAELQSFHDFATTILIALGAALLADLIVLPTLVRTFVRDRLSPSNI